MRTRQIVYIHIATIDQNGRDRKDVTIWEHKDGSFTFNDGSFVAGVPVSKDKVKKELTKLAKEL